MTGKRNCPCCSGSGRELIPLWMGDGAEGPCQNCGGTGKVVSPRVETCRKCGGQMAPGKAIAQTFSGVPDFPGGDVVTMSPGGPGRLVECLKCEKCGHSVSC